MSRCVRIVSLISLLAAAVAMGATEYSVVFPDDAGVVDVTKPPYEADTIHDATAAIQQALDDYPNGNRIIYLPAGTYKVSSTLRWGGTTSGNREKRTSLHGQGRDQTFIRLVDNTDGFSDAGSPAAVVWCGTAPAQRFGNAIRHLTIHTGTGNPGACGIRYNTSNQGMIERVRIVSGDGTGVTGLDIAYTNEIGPALVRHLAIEGFDYGIETRSNVNSMTFEFLSLSGQGIAGIKNRSQVLTFRGLSSVNTVPVLVNGPGSAVATIIDAAITGGDGEACAIRNEGRVFVRNLQSRGYGCVIDNVAGITQRITTAQIDEFVSHPPVQLFPSPARSMNLAVPESPEPAYPPPAQWVNVMNHGAAGNGKTDDTEAIQKAIDAGKHTVYFPAPYTFRIDGTVRIRGGVQRIIGTRGKLTGGGTLLFENSAGEQVVFERFDWGYSAGPSLEVKGAGTVAIRSCALPGITAGGTGQLFVDDVTNHTMRDKKLPLVGLHITSAAQTVWCRQFNPETHRAPKIINEGGQLWILGLKTENANTILKATGGAITELLGAHIFAQGDMKTNPMIVNHESALSVAGLRQYDWHNPNRSFTELVSETRDSDSKILTRQENGDFLTLYTGYRQDLTVTRPRAAAHGAWSVASDAAPRHFDPAGRLLTATASRRAMGVIVDHRPGGRALRRIGR